jgi:hypothetical protein
VSPLGRRVGGSLPAQLKHEGFEEAQSVCDGIQALTARGLRECCVSNRIEHGMLVRPVPLHRGFLVLDRPGRLARPL